LACWGVRGGRAGRPFSVVIDPGGPNERAVDALADAEPVRAGEGIRIRTTGGGGGGGPPAPPGHGRGRGGWWGEGLAAGRRRGRGALRGWGGSPRRHRPPRGRPPRSAYRHRALLRPGTGLSDAVRWAYPRRGRPAVRVLIALGGNAMTGPDGRATPDDQIAAA